uniref:Poly(ADP-ribose) glycohydrolase n=1 Tax=Mesocestoides corti TaxID=53468 RepID=A0A5K3FBE8_MESCO
MKPCSTSAESTDKWDSFHVKMPFSPQNLHNEKGNSVSRWSLIERTLSAPIKSVQDFAAAVHSYNTRFAKVWNFRNLSMALQMQPDYEQLLPRIAELALKLPCLITQ